MNNQPIVAKLHKGDFIAIFPFGKFKGVIAAGCRHWNFPDFLLWQICAALGAEIGIFAVVAAIGTKHGHHTPLVPLYPIPAENARVSAAPAFV
jgi:hypothetical protein